MFDRVLNTPQALVQTPDTGRKLNVHRTFRRRPGRLLNVLCSFNLRPVSTGLAVQYLLNNSIWMVVFIKLGHKFVVCIFSGLSSILKVPYLLHEHPNGTTCYCQPSTNVM